MKRRKADEQGVAVQLWEYMVLKIDTRGFLGLSAGRVDGDTLSETLNSLGRQGWEVATSLETAWGNGGTREVNLVLKRPKH